MQSELPFYESPEDAVRAAVQALGGAKKVGPLLWPDKGVDNAARLLLDCVNPARAEKLELTQALLIFSMARDAGCYGPFQWFAAEAGFDARPVTRADEVDRLTSVVEQSSKTLSAALATLERIRRCA